MDFILYQAIFPISHTINLLVVQGHIIDFRYVGGGRKEKETTLNGEMIVKCRAWLDL